MAAALALLPAAGVLAPARAAAEQATVLAIDGAIGPAIAGHVVRVLSNPPAGTRVIILRMNTPGGLDTSMREIIRAMLASAVPVVTYVAPSGARAASAGTYISYASAVAAMAPGTNIGAATPIALGRSPQPGKSPEPVEKGQEPGKREGSAAEPADAESRKLLNDAVAFIRSLAELHGRNAEWAAEAVRTAASLPASEALELHVVDVIAGDLPELLRKIDGRSAIVAGKPLRLATSGLEVATVAPDWRTELLAVVTDPNIAFMLMLIGVYGLVFEFLNPGTIVPGLLGSISLLVALYALNLLPISYAGAALVLLGIGLMIAEVHIGAFGVIGVAGIAAFVIGAIMMFPSAAPAFRLSPAVIGVATAVSAGLILVVLALLLRSRRRPVVTGKEALIGASGEATDWGQDEGRVRVEGEIWRARAAQPLQPGTRIKVVKREGLVLVVEPA
ncbi:MAG TPA: nodulation protein NfeD [Xanthobacteraceae bacterium]